MAWLKSVLKRPEAPQIEEEISGEQLPIPSTDPLLAVLVPDTGGVSSFRLRDFYEAESAAAYVATLMPQVRRSVFPFWGLHDPPVSRDDLKVEAIVMIRANEGSDLVYIVSFLDLESAYSFTRFEVKRGLQLTNVMIYWAAFADVVEDANGISILPSVPPVTAPSAWPETRHQIATIEPRTVAKPEPPTVAPPQEPTAATEESDALDAVERYLQNAQVADLADAEIARPVIETGTDAEDGSADGPMWPEAPVAEVAADPLAEITPEVASPPVKAGGDLCTEDPAEQEALKQAYVFHHKLPALPDEAIEAGMIEVEPEPLLPVGAVIADIDAAVELDRGYVESDVDGYPGDEENEIERWKTADPELPSAFKPYDEFDVAYEVERLLKNRSFEKRDGPFSGFRSPPGRF